MKLNKIKAALTVLECRKMTVEELEKKANLYADEHYDDTDEYGNWFSDLEMLRRAYIAGAKELQEEIDQLVKYCKELEAGFLNYKRNYKTKRQKVYELETKIETFEKENEKLKSINKKMQCCKNCKKYRMLESQVSLRCLKNRRINFCCEEWEFGE